MDAGDAIEKWKDVENWQRKLSNKYNSREFAKRHNCKVAQLYWRGRDLNSLDFSSLPCYFVIRPTIGHSLSHVFLMKNSVNLMDGKTYSTEDIKEVLTNALSDNKKVEFLFEEFIRTECGDYCIPDDYKFYMFNGQVGCIQVINRINNKQGCTTWYDENWKLLPNLTTNFPDGKEQSSPRCYEEMLHMAKAISKSYKIFIRIDFYATDKGVVFGELTPTPALGKGFTCEGDKLLSRYWDKFCKGMI